MKNFVVENHPYSTVSILIITGIIFVCTSIVFAVFAVSRAMLPYNSEGRYFDPDTTTVFHEQSVIVFGGISVALVVGAVAIVCFGRLIADRYDRRQLERKSTV